MSKKKASKKNSNQGNADAKAHRSGTQKEQKENIKEESIPVEENKQEESTEVKAPMQSDADVCANGVEGDTLIVDNPELPEAPPLEVKDEEVKEIVKYKLHLDDLNVAVNDITMIVKDGVETIKEGQEEKIAKQVLRKLSTKMWKSLSSNQIAYLAEHDPRFKHLNE